MRFFTPEWEFAAKRCHLRFGFDTDTRAKFFSESYYETVYKQALNKNVAMWERFHDESLLDLAIKLNKPLLDAGEMSQEDYEETLNESKQEDEKKAAFNKAETISRFHDKLLNTQETLQTLLPEPILSKVADIRALAVGTATPEICEEIKAYGEQNALIFWDAIEANSKHLESIWPSVPAEIRAYLFSLHDAMVERMAHNGDVCTLYLNPNQYNPKRVDSITFRDFEMMHIDEPIENERWVYVELDILSDGRYDVGILALSGLENEVLTGSRYKRIELRASNITFTSAPITQEEKEAEAARCERIDRIVKKGIFQCIGEGTILENADDR